jgi:hypothetical protein
MPMKMTLSTTRSGKPLVRSTSSGLLTEDDARQFHEAFSTSGPYRGLPLLAEMEKDTSFTAQSRKIFVQPNTGLTKAAIVINSAPLRVMLNFMVKASAIGGRPDTMTQFFSTIPEAESWLAEDSSS